MMTKLSAVLLFISILHASAEGLAQSVSLQQKGMPLKEAFNAIRKQTGYNFLWAADNINSSQKVDVALRNVSLDEAISQLLQGLPLSYEIKKETILIKEKEKNILDRLRDAVGAKDGVETQNLASLQQPITGRVLSETGEPMRGATIRVKRTDGRTDDPIHRVVSTDRDGRFTLRNVPEGASLSISYVGYETLEVNASGDLTAITLTLATADLEEVTINKGYYTESQRLSTGSVVKVSSTEIERQPVSNPIATLAGRVPGLTVTQTSGNPGGEFAIQIRGRNSITQGSEPLVLIDGIPFSNGYIGTNDIVASNGGQSPFSNINSLDIESIDVLKDADATAIYGSRGANGVILITTKKGSAGATKVDASVYQGVGQITRRLDLLNTQQYVEMRKEAFANDGVTPTAVNAPDLLLWDTTRYTDWQDEFIGGTANYTNANVALSGGSEYTQFLASANYNRQTTVNPGEFAENRGTGRFNITHASKDRRFKANITTNYSLVNNQLPGDLVRYLMLPPNNPLLLDESGNLVWEENGGTFTNPLANLYQKSVAKTDNFLANLNLQYEIHKNLYLRMTGGYNFTQFDETYLSPSIALSPNSSSQISSSKFTNTTSKNWIIEPQIEYTKKWGKGTLNALIGTTLQNDNRELQVIEASDFPNDELLDATAFAKTVTTRTANIEYRYQALFGRINYNYEGKYLINLTGRRDGSSRFGPGRKVSNFGAIGAAWIFSEESGIKNGVSWLSFGKLRGSYGVTGNDQIGDYQYLDNYSSTDTPPYQGQVGYIPSRLYNADYSWEQNKKLEAALDLGFLKNRIQVTANWFRNRSDNQLVNYKLPDQTGFPFLLRNFGALVQNTGWEFMLAGSPIQKKNFQWTTSLNVTLNRNKLLEFPGLEASSYANTLVIGKPLNIAKYLHYTGVDPETGIYTFDGTSRPANQTVIADFTPKYYGGWNNSITYKNWDFSFLLQFVKQNGNDNLTSSMPGTRNNQPIDVLERWQKSGDISNVQRFSTAGTASTAFNNFSRYSNAKILEASFIRLKNLYLSYGLPGKICTRLGFKQIKFYYQGQNLFTVTSYKGFDPETGNAAVPPLNVHSLGLQFTL